MVSHHYCAVPPTVKIVEYNNVMLYSLAVNQRTIKRGDCKHFLFPNAVLETVGEERDKAFEDRQKLKTD